jgi:hypothetical protein
MNKVGRSLTAVVPLGSEAGLAYRQLYDELWRAAAPVAPLTITNMVNTGNPEDPDPAVSGPRA